ncbi:MFS transporter [Saccharothrix sp. AJ9571]|nr:MFS transporter [Saccharothrix sp. AJ9571]
MTTPGLLRNRDFVRLWTGQAVSSLGSGVAAITYPVLALTVAGSTALAGLVGFVALAGGALLRLPAGALVDRWPLKPVLVTAEATRAAVTGLLVLALLLDRLTLAQLLLSAFVTSVSGVLFDTAHAVALRHVVPSGQLAPAFALTESRSHVADLVGRPAGGYLYQMYPVLPVLADTLSFLSSASLAASIRQRMAPSAPPTPRRLRHDIGDGLRHVLGQPLLRVCLVYAAVFQFVLAGLPLALISLMRADNVGTGQLGALFAVAAAGGLLGAAAAPAVQARLSPPVLVLGFGWTAALLLLAIGVPQGPWTTGALLGALFLSAAPANAMLLAVQLHSTPAALHGRVLSAGMFIAGLGAPLGPPVVGALADLHGRTWTSTTLACGVAVFTVGMHCLRSVRTMTRPV